MTKKATAQQGSDLLFPEIEAYSDPIDPAALLTEISDTIQDFIVCSQETANAAALWIAMTWFIDVIKISPLAVITAPEKRCGKSQLLKLFAYLVNRPLPTSNITPAALFRIIEMHSPTLLIDEADTFVRDNEELRGIINCGHTRDLAFVIRAVGNDHTPKRFTVWGAKALAGIGKLADTLMDRAITLELKRKLPHEKTEKLHHTGHERFQVLAQKLARFAQDYSKDIIMARPELPAELHDRAQDNWEPLLAIADIAGDHWAKLARIAAIKISGEIESSQSISIELLADIQEILDTHGGDRMTSKALIEALCSDDEKPWATYNRGFPIKPRQLVAKLKDFGIHSNTIRIDMGTAKGYMRSYFDDAFDRYLDGHTATTVTT